MASERGCVECGAMDTPLADGAFCRFRQPMLLLFFYLFFLILLMGLLHHPGTALACHPILSIPSIPFIQSPVSAPHVIRPPCVVNPWCIKKLQRTGSKSGRLDRQLGGRHVVWWVVARTNGSIPVPVCCIWGRLILNATIVVLGCGSEAYTVYYGNTAGHQLLDHKCDKHNGSAEKREEIASQN